MTQPRDQTQQIPKEIRDHIDTLAAELAKAKAHRDRYAAKCDRLKAELDELKGRLPYQIHGTEIGLCAAFLGRYAAENWLDGRGPSFRLVDTRTAAKEERVIDTKTGDELYIDTSIDVAWAAWLAATARANARMMELVEAVENAVGSVQFWRADDDKGRTTHLNSIDIEKLHRLEALAAEIKAEQGGGE